MHYAEAVRIPGTPLVKVSGKGGWDSQNFEMAEGDVNGQIELAFKNVDIALKHAGLKGWENVYLIRTYHTVIDSGIKQIAEATSRRCPANTPVCWTAIGVVKLGNPKMLVEVEVEAHDDSGR
jgi:enamine deaminase RidA (YjgF/YER057c/UK114 family)